MFVNCKGAPRNARAGRQPHPTGGKADLGITRSIKSSYAYGHAWRTGNGTTRKVKPNHDLANWRKGTLEF